MKRQIITIVILTFIFAVVAFLSFVPFVFTKSVEVAYEHDRVMQQLNRTEKIKKWYLPFANVSSENIYINDSLLQDASHQHSLIIKRRNFLSVEYNSNANKRSELLIFSTAPAEKKSVVTLVYSAPILKNLIGSATINDAKNSLENLKRYMEDIRLFYGYPIKEVLVTDTSFLFTKKIVNQIDFQKGTQELFNRLIAYADEHDANYNGVRIFHSQKIDSNKVELFAAIGVTNRVDTDANKDIEYKMMPYQKNLLVADYYGPYKNVSDVYASLEAYKQDHNYSSMAIPFEKFLTEGYGFADTQKVKLQVYYPVF